MIGALIGGKYRIESVLGEGGMGSVHVAVQEPLGRTVALKMIRGSFDEGARIRFEREAKIVASLRCPHIVTLFDFGEHDGEPYIVLELLEGETLRDRINRGAIPLDEALSLARDIACGLRSAHEMGVVHRDLKPENVVVVPDKDRGSRAKLLDFGIAKPQNPAQGLTEAGVVSGTVGYMAPEVVLHGASTDPRIDLYALGVILFEMITGTAPFEAPTALGVIAAHTNQTPPDVRSRRPDASSAIATIIDTLLRKDPMTRFESSDVVIREIDLVRTGYRPTAAIQPLEQTFGSGALSIPAQPSIGVQPFMAPGGSDDDVYFAEGLSEDILTGLSRFKHLFVVSQMTMTTTDGRETDPLRLGRTLGVHYVVQGSVRRSGGRARVSAKLIEVQRGAQIWAQRYDIEAGDFFALEDEITQSIVSAVAGKVEAAHAERVRRLPPQSLAAYDLLARGRHYHHRRTPEDNARSREALDRAVELDPEYAHAHAWRACAYGQALGMGAQPFKEFFGRLMTSLQKSLALDDSDAECHRMACEIAFGSDITKAEHHHRRARELNPNDARIVGQAGELAMYIGDLDDAAREIMHAMRLDPLTPTPYLRLLLRVRYLQGDFKEAWRLFRCIDDESAGFIGLGAAVAAAGGEPFAPLAEKVRLLDPTWNAMRRVPPFRDERRRADWLRGFEAAGLLGPSAT